MRHPTHFRTPFHEYSGDGRPFGQGGAGIVYRVRDESGRELAVKVYAPSDPSTIKRKRFENEIGLLQKRVHPNIVPVEAYGLVQVDGEDRPFFAMPFYASTLRNLMDERPGIKPAAVLPLFDQLLSAVEAAHRLGVHHRDIKPQNVLVDPANMTLALTDFGIAHIAEELMVTEVETKGAERLAGLYAAPEQLIRGAEVDQRADIFALGLILAEMFTHEVPRGQDYRTIGSVTPKFAYLDDLVKKMIQQTPENRPASIEDVKGELLARGAEFVQLQKVSELERTVVPAETAENPFAENPVRVIAADVDLKSTPPVLTLTLNRPVTEKWQTVFVNAPFGFTAGYPPRSFRFDRAKTSVPLIDTSHAQHVIDTFKTWLEMMGLEYRRFAEAEAGKAAAAARAQLEARKRREAETLRINRSLRV